MIANITLPSRNPGGLVCHGWVCPPPHVMQRRFLGLALLALLFWMGSRSLPADPPPQFYLKDGDRVVFYGGNETNWWCFYTLMVEDYVLTRFPKMQVTFVHSNWPNDIVGNDPSASDGWNGWMLGSRGPIDVRVQRDVLDHHPTVMTIMLGMSDGEMKPFDQTRYDAYTKGYAQILDTVKQAAPEIRLTLLGTSPFDDITRPPTFDGGYNAVLQRFVEFNKVISAQRHETFADLNASLCDVLTRAKQVDPTLAKKILTNQYSITSDRTGGSPASYLINAATLLKAWHAPALVANVEIDAQTTSVTNAQNTVVSELSGKDGLTWKQQDICLPFPIVHLDDPVVKLVLNSSDVLQALDQEILTVKHLPGDKYTLQIDNRSVGTFSKAEWEQGVNLATLPTPMRDQADAIHDLTIGRTNAYRTRFSALQLSVARGLSATQLQKPEVQKAIQTMLQAFDDEDADRCRKQHEAAQPKQHTYQLSRQ